MIITITRPKREDEAEIKEFFSIVVHDTFARNDASHVTEGIQREIAYQTQNLKKDLETNGIEVYYLIAKVEKQIIGTIAHGKPNDRIKKYSAIDFEHIPEIKSVYILPGFQGKRIGELLWNSILLSLYYKGVKEICLDCGYTTAQRYWKKKLGSPTVFLKDHWAKDAHHMIWHRRLEELPIIYAV